MPTIAWYTPIVFTLTLILLTWRFGDWENWKTYYSTILYITVVCFFALILTYNYPLWSYQETFLSPNRIIHELRLAFLVLPLINLLYLSYYPFQTKISRQLIYIGIWTAIWSSIEVFYILSGIMTLHHGWNILWSIIVWALMYTVIPIHHRNPPWAWLICVVFSVFAIIYFDIPLL